MKRRVISIVLSCFMALTLLPCAVYADAEGMDGQPASGKQLEESASEEMPDAFAADDPGAGELTEAEEQDEQTAVEAAQSSDDEEGGQHEESPEEPSCEPAAQEEEPAKPVEPSTETEKEASSEAEIVDVPQAEKTASPEGEIVDVPQAEKAAPQAEKAAAPASEPEGTPEEPDAPAGPVSIEQAEISGLVSMPYTGKRVTQNEDSIKVVLDGTELVADTDYTVSYENNVNAGEATVVITGKGDYTGKARAAFTITRKDLSKATVTGITDKAYIGKTRYQNPVIKIDGVTLVKNEDYKLTHKNSLNAGTATLTITGIGNYKGTITRNYTITRKDLSKATVTGIANKAYTGNAIYQKPVVMFRTKGVTLVKNKDYKLSYKNNKAVGTATVTITGIGNYKGTIKRTFKITDKAARYQTVSTLKCGFKNKAYINYRLPLSAKPYNLYLTARKGGVIELLWTDCRKYGGDVDGYIILRKTKSGGTYMELARVGGGTLKYTDKSKKKNEHMYYYAIVGYKKNSNGTYSISPARNAGGVTYESKASNPYKATISKTAMTLNVGSKKTLTLTYQYKNVCSTWTRWLSSDKAVATVDKNGQVTAKGVGTATITAKTSSGRNVRCVVTVKRIPGARDVVARARKEVGYAATGSGTYGTRFSKYAEELDAMGDIYNGPKNGYDWCDIFADWCYIKVMGKARAVKAINQPLYGCGAGCYFSAGYFREMGRFSDTPTLGAQIFFDWDGDAYEDHTGIVVSYDDKYVYTVEGNTGGGNGKVAEKKYLRTDSCITGYGRPKW